MFSDLPVALAWVALWAVAFLRGCAVYAASRGVRIATERGVAEGGWRDRLLHHRHVRAAEALVRRRGALAVALCFLTVGLQTAVLIASGALRMPMRRYLPGLAVGACFWATIYVTVGLAVLGSIWRGDLSALAWVGGAVLAFLLTARLAALVVERRARARADDPAPTDQDHQHPVG